MLKKDPWTIGRDKKTREFFVYRVVSNDRVSWIEYDLTGSGRRFVTKYCLSVQRRCHYLRKLDNPGEQFYRVQEIRT